MWNVVTSSQLSNYHGIQFSRDLLAVHLEAGESAGEERNNPSMNYLYACVIIMV